MRRLVQIEKGAQFDVNTPADKVTFTIDSDIEVVECGVIVAGADPGGATIAFDRRVLAGSDSGRVDGGVGAITIPASDQQGKVLYEKPSGVVLNAGDQVVVEVTAEGVTALNVVPYIKYVSLVKSRANEDEASAA